MGFEGKKGEDKRPPTSGDAYPHAFSRFHLVPQLRENSRSHLLGGIIPGDFHPNRCYSAPTRKKRTPIFFSRADEEARVLGRK